MSVRLSRSLVAGLMLLSLTSSGCVCAFQREWSQSRETGVCTDNLAGLWEGTWESGYNGHTGKLRAIITRCDNGQYHAWYFATFAGCIPYAYETTHSATEQDGVTYFSGVQDLGPLAGGLYHTNGSANGQQFEARYQADKDFGVYRMTRVSTGTSCTDSCTPSCTESGGWSCDPKTTSAH